MSLQSIYIASTGVNAQQLVVSNTANNLANSNTTGFKRNQVDFQDLFYTTFQQPGGLQLQGQAVPTGLQLGNGVRVAGNTKVFTEGSLQNTGNPLDVAIQGQGFFQVTLPDGTLRYTRDGTFQLNQNGQLVTTDGFTITPAVTIPPDTTSIAIGTDGTVSVVTAGAPTTSTNVGQLQLARFPNPGGLAADGRNLFTQTPASGTPTLTNPGQNGAGFVQQGTLEGSNVDVVQELVNLIVAQRTYDFNTRAIRVSDEMLQTANALIP